MSLNVKNLTPGRKKDKHKKMLEMVGEERLNSLIELQITTAFSCSDAELKDAAQKFLINKCIPHPKPHSSYIIFSIKEMFNMNDVLINEINILTEVSKGEMSLDDAKELFYMTSETRKTFEQTEIARMINEFNEKMKQSGIKQ